MYLSYSGYKKYKDCPYAYWHVYVNKTVLEVPDDRLGSIYGSAVGKLFERFYNEHWWCEEKPLDFALSKIDEVTDDVIKRELQRGGVLLWRDENPKALYKDRDELIVDVREAVTRGFKTIRQVRLLGLYARAEVVLDSVVEGYRIGGRADFIVHRMKPHSDKGIYDGKGSKHRDKYVNPEQLFWYAMLYRLKFGAAPDKLAFIYWKFSFPESLDWVEFSEAELDLLLESALECIRKIESKIKSLPEVESVIDRMELAKKVFPPKASESNCRFCPFATATQCSWGHSMRMNQR